MIERYSLTSSAEQVRERFAVDPTDFYKSIFNASPTHLLPVITNTSPQGVSWFYWGETEKWAKNKTPAEKIINVRVENLHEKVALKKTMMKSRCLVPADGFYAWKKVGKKTSIPYRFVMGNNELFSVPALWEEFEDDDGSSTQTFSIFTVASNEIVSAIHDRMPVIFDKDDENIWLNKTSTENDLLALFTRRPLSSLHFYPVSPRINDTRVNLPSLVVPTPPSDQHGNLTLFD
jgi:putative SOS response-associated peptidase YedK